MILTTMTHIQSREQKSLNSVEQLQPEGLPSMSIGQRPKDVMPAHAQRQPERLQSNMTKPHATWMVVSSLSGCGYAAGRRFHRALPDADGWQPFRLRFRNNIPSRRGYVIANCEELRGTKQSRKSEGFAEGNQSPLKTFISCIFLMP